MKNIDTRDQQKQGDVARYCVIEEFRQVGGGVDVGGRVVSFIPVYYIKEKVHIYLHLCFFS